MKKQNKMYEIIRVCSNTFSTYIKKIETKEFFFFDREIETKELNGIKGFLHPTQL